MLYISQGSTKINYTDIRIVFVGNSKRVIVTLPPGTTGTVNVTVAQGNSAIVQSEQVGFTEIVFTDTTTFTGEGYITGLTRGQNTTITNSVFVIDSVVHSVLARNVLPQQYYNSNWYNIPGIPLEYQTSPAGLFLRQWFT